MRKTKSLYILTDLMAPINHLKDTREMNDSYFSKVNENRSIDFDTIDIKLVKVFIKVDKDTSKNSDFGFEAEARFAFYINNGKSDTKIAQHFADSVMLSLAIIYGTTIDNTPSFIEIPASKLRKNIISFKETYGELGSENYFKLSESIGVPDQVLNEVWRIAPILFNFPYILNASSYYRDSINKIWIADENVFEIIADNQDIPSSQADQAAVETAYQNAYKAIEAIIGEPSTDPKKLRYSLIQSGINFDEIVGCELYNMKPSKEKISKKILDMQNNRDKKAAHGKTNIPRTLGYCELKDKQALASYIILKNINSIINGASK